LFEFVDIIAVGALDELLGLISLSLGHFEDVTLVDLVGRLKRLYKAGRVLFLID